METNCRDAIWILAYPAGWYGLRRLVMVGGKDPSHRLWRRQVLLGRATDPDDLEQATGCGKARHIPGNA